MGKLVWLASYPKSGNTWVRAFLHNYITDAQAPHGINKLHEFSASECTAAFFRVHDARLASSYTEAEVQRLRPVVHGDLTRLHDDLVFIKTHNAALAVHGVPLCTPALTAGAIYIVRDPRDVAVSYARYTGRGVDEIISFMGNAGAANRSTEVQVFELLSSWSRHAESWAGVTRRLLVRYEDLLTAPETGFGRIVRFLGGEVDAARLARAVRHCEFAALAAQEAAVGYEARGPNEAAAFFHTGKAGQWKTALSDAQVARIEADHAAVMRGFGYLG